MTLVYIIYPIAFMVTFVLGLIVLKPNKKRDVDIFEQIDKLKSNVEELKKQWESTSKSINKKIERLSLLKNKEFAFDYVKERFSPMDTYLIYIYKNEIRSVFFDADYDLGFQKKANIDKLIIDKNGEDYAYLNYEGTQYFLDKRNETLVELKDKE